MKLPISWATKTPIPSSELSTTGKGLHPGNGECFKESLSRQHKRKLALRDTSQTGAPERPRPHNPKKRFKLAAETVATLKRGAVGPAHGSKSSFCPLWDGILGTDDDERCYIVAGPAICALLSTVE